VPALDRPELIWRCPRCRGPLAETAEALACITCVAEYPSFEGIPDLRLPGPCWIDYEADRAQARQLIAATAGFSVEETVRHVFSWRTEFDATWADKRTQQVMDAWKRLGPEMRGWLRDCVRPGRIFLDLGCGPGQLLAAAAAAGCAGIGIDVRLVWLLVAKRLIAAAGGTPVLAAALAESLPLADESLYGVVSLDVIEHVGDVSGYLREINRVTAPGAYVALATPNRFSLTAEPHVAVWGVGWIPRCLQKSFVKFRSGLAYEFVQLLSVNEARHLFCSHTRIDVEILVPEVPEVEISRYPAKRKALARFYNRLLRWRLLHPVFRLIGPFFRIVGRKSATPLYQ
jgi:SAM-dependent methyltransferase